LSEMHWTSLCGMLGDVSKGSLSGPMTQRDSVLFKSGWISLAIIGLAILVFGLIVTVVPTPSDPIHASDRCGINRDGVVRAPDYLDRLQTPRTLGLVRLMVLPPHLDSAPRRRIAAWQRSRPPARVHRSVASGSAPAGSRILPARGSTGIHDPVKVPITADFVELRQHEVRLSLGLEGLTQEGP
jgi:hypothetical protein